MNEMDLVQNIDMFAANLALLSFFIVAIKFISKRAGWKKLDVFLMKAHRPVGYVLLSAGIIHTVLSFRDISTTPIAVYALGIVCTLSIAAAILTYVFRKKLGKKWLFWHGAVTVIALVTLIAHPVLMNVLSN